MTDTQAHPGFEVAIIGAGPGGIAAAVKVVGALRYYFNDLNCHVPTCYLNSQ